MLVHVDFVLSIYKGKLADPQVGLITDVQGLRMNPQAEHHVNLLMGFEIPS